jgi:hypothetical protein
MTRSLPVADLPESSEQQVIRWQLQLIRIQGENRQLRDRIVHLTGLLLSTCEACKADLARRAQGYTDGRAGGQDATDAMAKRTAAEIPALVHRCGALTYRR